MKCLINGKIIFKDSVKDGLAIVFDEKIEKILPQNEINLNDYEVIDAKGNFAAPGLVDVHIHRYLGADVSDGVTEGLITMAKGIIENGVTAWCPTTMTVSKAEILATFDTARELKIPKNTTAHALSV